MIVAMLVLLFEKEGRKEGRKEGKDNGHGPCVSFFHHTTQRYRALRVFVCVCAWSGPKRIDEARLLAKNRDGKRKNALPVDHHTFTKSHQLILDLQHSTLTPFHYILFHTMNNNNNKYTIMPLSLL